MNNGTSTKGIITKLHLADYAAVASDGKLNIVGAGISIVGSGNATFGVWALLDWPSSELGYQHTIQVKMVDEDRHLFEFALPDGSDSSVQLTHTAPLIAAPGVAPGTRIVQPLAMQLGGLPLPPGRTFQLRIEIDGEWDEDWFTSFTTR